MLGRCNRLVAMGNFSWYCDDERWGCSSVSWTSVTDCLESIFSNGIGESRSSGSLQVTLLSFSLSSLWGMPRRWVVLSLNPKRSPSRCLIASTIVSKFLRDMDSESEFLSCIFSSSSDSTCSTKTCKVKKKNVLNKWNRRHFK